MSEPPSEPAQPRPGSEPGDVRLLVTGLGLGAVFGGVLVGVVWLAVGAPPPPAAGPGPDEATAIEERDQLRKQLVELQARDPRPPGDKPPPKDDELRTARRQKDAAEQERAKLSKEVAALKIEKGKLEQRLKAAEKDLADERARGTSAKTEKVAQPPPPPPVKEPEVTVSGPVVATNGPNVQLAKVGAGEYVTPVGVPEPAYPGTKSTPYVIYLNKVALVRVDNDGVARSRFDEVKPFPHIWCGLVAVRSKNNPAQKPRYHRAYNPPAVELPPKVGTGRWEFAIATAVKSDEIADLRHYIQNKGELALGGKAAVRFDGGPGRELTPPPNAADGEPPNRLVDRKGGAALELTDGVLVVTAAGAAKSLCEIVELDVVRPVPDVPELKARGVTVFSVRKK